MNRIHVSVIVLGLLLIPLFSGATDASTFGTSISACQTEAAISQTSTELSHIDTSNATAVITITMTGVRSTDS